MNLRRKLGLMELEQRIAPATTITLISGSPDYSFTEADGDTVFVHSTGIPGGINPGSIALTDTGAGPFDSLDSVVFDGLCVQATTLSVAVTGGSGDGGATVGVIDSHNAAHIGTISVEGNVTGATVLDSIYINDVDYLHIYSPRSSDGGAQNLAILGDVSAVGTQYAVHIGNAAPGSATFDGHMEIEGAIHGGSLETGIYVDGTIGKAAPSNAIIDVGDMTGKVIQEVNNNIALQNSTININGNTAQVLAGNLGGVHTAGSIIGVTFNIHGNLDASGLASSRDAIATDWDGNGTGTITNTTVNMTNGGYINGTITNNKTIYSGSAINDTEDMSININTHGGNLRSSSTNGLFLMSGGSLTGSIDTRGSDGYLDGDIVACKNIGNGTASSFTVYAGNLYGAGGYQADFYADGERYLLQYYSVPLPGWSYDDDGTITGLAVTISGDVRSHTSFNNDFNTTDFDGDNVVSGALVFSFTGPNTDFDATVVSGGNIGASATVINVGGDFGGIITAYGNIDLNLTAGSATGGGLGTYGYIHAGDTNSSGSLSGLITLNGDGNAFDTAATNFDVKAYYNITAGFDIHGSVDSDCQWFTDNTVSSSTDGNFAPATVGVHVTGNFAGQISASNDIKFADGTSFTIGGDFTSTASLTANNNAGAAGDINFDPSSFACNNFAGTWSGQNILFDASSLTVDGNFKGLITAEDGNVAFSNGSSLDIQGDMTGTIEAKDTAFGPGNILFTDSVFFIHNFAGTTPGPQGKITADNNFTFTGDSTNGNEFRVDEFDGALTATTGAIKFENVVNPSMLSMFGDFSKDGLIQSPGDITFSNALPTMATSDGMTNFAGTIQSTDGSIIFHNFNFIVDKLFSGDFLAYKDITWDPSVFSTYDYNGTWVAATGDITFDSGSEFTVSHRWYDYNTSYIEATLGSIIFTGTEVFIENFDGRMTAGTDFTFDGEDGADFHTDWFFGVIEADNDITFTNGVFDFGQYMTGADINAGHDILFGNTNAGMDSMYATVFAGDLTAGNMLTFQNIYDMELDMVTYESEWTAPNGVKLDAVTLITVFDFDGEIDVANGDIDFINSSVEIGGDFLSWFNASDNIEFTSTTVDIDGDFGYWGEWNAGGDIIFDSSLIEGGHLTIGGDYIGSMEASNITFTDTDLIIGGDFTGEMHAMAGDITFDPSNITVGGDFSGKVEASDNINIDGEVIIDGAFTSHGLWKADGGDMSLSLVADTFVVNGPFDGLITAYDNLAGDFDFNYAGWNGGQIIANSSGGLTGILSGTLDSTGSWGKTSAFSGAGISMYFSIDGDSYSAFTATYNQGITGSIEIGDPLTHLNVFGGTITSAGDIHSVIINGTFINDPVVWNLSAVGTVQYFYAYALGAYVNMKAAHWDTVIIGEGGMSSSFGEILAGNEQLAAPYGTSSIDALTIMGPHPEGAALASKVHAHQGGIWKISESLIVTPLGHDFPVDGGGDVFIKTKGGTVQVDYYNAHLTTGPINEIRHIIYETGKQCDLWATGSSDLIWNPYFPAIGLISAPLAPRPGYTNPIPTSIHDINTKNLDVTEINITGNANNINITNGDLDFLTVGDENYFQGTFDDKAVGNLKNLIIKNGSIGSYVGADIKILSSLSGKIVADEIMGTMELGSAMHSGKFGTIQANYDFDSTLTVYGKLKEIVAKNDTDLDVDITIHGSLNNLTMAKARFTSHVQCEELGGTFDVYGGNADRTLTYGYETTSAQYNTGGVLTVFDITKSQRIH